MISHNICGLSHAFRTCQIGDEAQETMHQEQQKLTEVLDDLLKSGASESEIYAKIEVVRTTTFWLTRRSNLKSLHCCAHKALSLSLLFKYKEKFADYGRDRRSAIEFHLRNVERLLMPTQTTSVVLATLQGGTAAESATATNTTTTNAQLSDNSSKSTIVEAPSQTLAQFQTDTLDSSSTLAPLRDNKALFKHLVKILEVTPEQAAALKDSRFVAQEMDEILTETLSVLTELRSRLTQCGEDLETEFNNVRTILTPSQSAKFLVWVSQNKACMHMLNELWSKVYPSSQRNGCFGDDITLTPSGESSP
jgi:hypothetical protein